MSVRDACVSDAAQLSALFNLSWTYTYTGIIPQPHLGAMIARRTAGWWSDAIETQKNVLVMDVAGKLAGYATLGRARQAPMKRDKRGEIYEIYLGPVYQGVGLGEFMFEACRSTLDASGTDGLLVWALAGNERAGEFYERRGGRQIARTYERVGGKRLEKIAYGWM